MDSAFDLVCSPTRIPNYAENIRVTPQLTADGNFPKSKVLLRIVPLIRGGGIKQLLGKSATVKSSQSTILSEPAAAYRVQMRC